MKLEFHEACRSHRRAFRSYVDGDATGLERLAFERHAEDCVACARAWESAQSLDRELHRLDGAEPDAAFEQRIVAAVHARLDASVAPSLPAPGTIEPAPTAQGHGIRALRRAAAAALVLGLAAAAWRATTDDASLSALDPSSTAPGDVTSAQVPAPEDLVDPVRLAEAKASFARIVLESATHDAPLAAYAAAVVPLRRAGWPVETMLVAAIDDPNLAFARAAIQLAAAARLERARPALLRADRRAALRQDATRALGTVADGAIVALLRKRLDDPSLWAAAIDALEASPRRDALAALAEAARDTSRLECAAEARLALARRGAAGAHVLLELAANGDGDAARVLSSSQAVDAALTLELLRTPRDVELARLAIELLQDDAALRLFVAHDDALRDAFGADAAARDVEARLRRCFELPELVRTALVTSQGDAAAWIDLLARHPDPGVPTLCATVADSALELSIRVRAAVTLAALDRLDPDLAIATAIEALPFDLDSAATLLCCAVRAGQADAELPGFDPRRTRDSFRSARTAVDRWRADGRPPESWERARIAAKLANARL